MTQYGKLEEQEFDEDNPNKFKDENMYKYHDNTQRFDPIVQPYSFFYVTISGQINFGEFIDHDGLAVKYDFVAGPDWNIAGGDKSGQGQHAFKSSYGSVHAQRIVWNLPFEVTYRSMNPHGWPQIVIYCTYLDSDGDEYVKAYGCTHVPIQPGIVQKTVRMFTPIEHNRCLEFFGRFREGTGLFIDDPELIAKAQGREISRVKAGGKVTFSM